MIWNYELGEGIKATQDDVTAFLSLENKPCLNEGFDACLAGNVWQPGHNCH